MVQIKVRQVGGSVGATIPKEMAEHLHIAAGDTLYAIETERGILLTPYDPTFDKAQEAFTKVSRRYRNALRELAK
ncbi:MAG: AbrB/MazE/SpoVT family DNA-binding domain-containing protein [Proteobacteria bacterium]|nr:AbrB/MazE/SpoVT family DNA-binding domain-containing protein [Pseudomonadota bacterium]